MTVSLLVMLREVDREIAMRRAVYRRQVEAGRLSQAKADRQLNAMLGVERALQQAWANHGLISVEIEAETV